MSLEFKKKFSSFISTLTIACLHVTFDCSILEKDQSKMQTLSTKTQDDIFKIFFFNF